MFSIFEGFVIGFVVGIVAMLLVFRNNSEKMKAAADAAVEKYKKETHK